MCVQYAEIHYIFSNIKGRAVHHKGDSLRKEAVRKEAVRKEAVRKEAVSRGSLGRRDEEWGAFVGYL